MQKILSIGSKQFLTGIAPSAHSETGGLFLAADGVTPLYDAGGTASVENGLLQAGNAGTDFSATDYSPVGTIIAGCSGARNSFATHHYFMSTNGHIYRKPVGSGAVEDIAPTNTFSNPTSAMEIWGPSGTIPLLYYWYNSLIGTYDLTGNLRPAVTDAHWVHSAYSAGVVNFPHTAVWKFSGNLYFTNGSNIASLVDAGSGAITANISTPAFAMPYGEYPTAISDDGTYLVMASTTNTTQVFYNSGTDYFAKNVIYFWDTISPTFTRAFEIRDSYISKLIKVGSAVYAFGKYGIYEVTLAGVKKILSRNIGAGTVADISAGYVANRATSYNGSALLFATDTTVDTFGKLSPDLQSAYFKHFKVPSGRPTFVSASLDAGRVYVATTTPKLYAFDFNGTTRGTGVSAQTVYFPLPSKFEIQRIDVIFGEPLATGDSMSVQLKSDEDTTAGTATSLLSASYATDGAIRSKAFKVLGFRAEDQLSVVANFTAGAVKIKRVDVYGSRIPIA